MGVFEKLKNALFEEEIVEIEEKPKKPKTKKQEVFKDFKQDKPIAKKVVLPEKREVKVEELDEEDLIDEDFEIEPVKREEKEEVRNEKESYVNFDITEDDFKVEDTYQEKTVEPEIVKVLDKDERLDRVERVETYERVTPREEIKYYQQKPVEKVPYGGASSKVNKSEFGGAYEKKDARTHFTPSPIISPIYGILDKNYKKEDVVQKKEVRLTSSYTRNNLNLDDVRKKAYGNLSDDFEREFDAEPLKREEYSAKDEDEDINLLVDLSEDEKPSVKEVTMGDALEYFHDLGLEYNVDYVDATKDRVTGRRVRENYEDSQEFSEKEDTRLSRLSNDKVEVPVKEEKEVELDSDDNLFDLIDSMYKEND